MPCRHADFEAVLPSANQARHWVQALLGRWELQELVDTATLLTSELVANAVVHAGSGPVVSMAVASGLLEVGVRDRERRLPRLVSRPASPSDLDEVAFMTERGRGLFLVDALADEWGATSLTTGKQVWFRLEAPGWAYRPDCRCHHDGPDLVLLDSGRTARAVPGPWDSVAS